MKEHITPILSFEDLDVWKVCRNFKKRCATLCRTFPREEQYRLVDQLIRSSRSVTANIAEGYGRFHYQENIQFCRQARGSLNESLNHIIDAYDEEYINDEVLADFKKEFFICVKLLNGYINYLAAAKKTRPHN